jgi:hypothetical protein
MMWSSSGEFGNLKPLMRSGVSVPQIWQVQLSRLKTSHLLKRVYVPPYLFVLRRAASPWFFFQMYRFAQTWEQYRTIKSPYAVENASRQNKHFLMTGGVLARANFAACCSRYFLPHSMVQYCCWDFPFKYCSPHRRHDADSVDRYRYCLRGSSDLLLSSLGTHSKQLFRGFPLENNGFSCVQRKSICFLPVLHLWVGGPTNSGGGPNGSDRFFLPAPALAPPRPLFTTDVKIPVAPQQAADIQLLSAIFVLGNDEVKSPVARQRYGALL